MLSTKGYRGAGLPVPAAGNYTRGSGLLERVEGPVRMVIPAPLDILQWAGPEGSGTGKTLAFGSSSQ
jgi:hypothetical protein